jgi:enamine deaminase RidA (YjgF/YER057c/UK114 family)
MNEHAPVDSAVPVSQAVAETLRDLAEQANAEADRFAEQAGQERATAGTHQQRAAEHEQQAEQLLDKAAEVRRREELWRELLQAVEARLPEQPAPAPAAQWVELFEASNWQGPPTRVCNGCGAALRPANVAEIEAHAARRGLPDVRRECPDCRLMVAVQRQPYREAAS